MVNLIDRLATLAGVALVIYGAAMLSSAAAVILAGCFLLTGALWRART